MSVIKQRATLAWVEVSWKNDVLDRKMLLFSLPNVSKYLELSTKVKEASSNSSLCRYSVKKVWIVLFPLELII